MKANQFLLVALFFMAACSPKNEKQGNEILFDFDWKFALNDHPGAESTGFDDSRWRTLDVPHDFSIEQPFDENNATKGGGGYAFSGIGWYRKHFTLGKETEGKRVVIRFNGVYRNSDVWVNGQHLGFRPYGYSTFTYDLTPYLKPAGQENILAVKVNTSEQPSSRWYTGAGIYRHVWLHVSDNTHFSEGGVFVQTSEVKDGKATLKISSETEIAEGETRKLQIKASLYSPYGKLVATQTIDIKQAAKTKTEGEIEVASPQLWSINHPYLYRFVCQLVSGEDVLDEYSTDTGIRTIAWHPDKGFLLNGEHIKLKGTNNHHDGGLLGSACMDYTFERQVRILKSMGSNALRMSHNPPAPELLECADRLGMVVIDEIFDEWRNGKCKAGYSPYFDEWHEKDIADWMRRDRNHACVVAWSLGNEVPEQRMDTVGANTLKQIIATAKQHDTSRPFTSACNEMPDANQSGFAGLLDIVGYNYREPMYKADHQKYPHRVIFGSETVMYPYHPGDRFPLHNYQDWITGQMENYVAGEFLWTGFDYLGETGIGSDGTSYEPWKYWPRWPWRSAVCGVVDLCGADRPAYWYRKALWGDEPVLYIAVPVSLAANKVQECPFWGWPDVWPHWNYEKKGEPLTVQVYTNCKSTELLLNGKSLGSKECDIFNEAFLTWDVPYEPGTLEATGTLPNGEKINTVLKTAGEATTIVLTPERGTIKADKQDVDYVKLELLDKEGTPVPFAQNKIQFSVSGAGKLLAVGNGNPQSHTPFKGQEMEAFHGRCLAIIQAGSSPGTITLTATAEGLKPASVQIETR